MNARSLRAFVNAQEVGVLEESAGLWQFRYAPAWLKDAQGYALSPHLPLSAEPLLDGASLRPVQWYFDNLLPEEGQRVLLAGDARIDAADEHHHVAGVITRSWWQHQHRRHWQDARLSARRAALCMAR